MFLWILFVRLKPDYNGDYFEVWNARILHQGQDTTNHTGHSTREFFLCSKTEDIRTSSGMTAIVFEISTFNSWLGVIAFTSFLWKVEAEPETLFQYYICRHLYFNELYLYIYRSIYSSTYSFPFLYVEPNSIILIQRTRKKDSTLLYKWVCIIVCINTMY